MPPRDPDPDPDPPSSPQAWQLQVHDRAARFVVLFTDTLRVQRYTERKGGRVSCYIVAKLNMSSFPEL